MADRRYYTEGSSARQLNYDDRAGRNRSREAVVRGSAAPARRPQPSVRPERAPQPARRKKQGSSHLTDRERRELAARKAQRKAVTNAQIRYTAGMVAAIIVALSSNVHGSNAINSAPAFAAASAAITFDTLAYRNPAEYTCLSAVIRIFRTSAAAVSSNTGTVLRT